MTDSNFQTELWQMQMQRDIPGLIATLRHENPVIRRRAAAALRALGADEALQPLIRAFETEADPETRAHIAAAMESLQNTPPDKDEKPATANDVPAEETSELSRLIQQLKSAHVEQVVEAAHKLGELSDKLAVEPLIFLFNAPDTPIKVRLAVAEALLELDSAPVEVTLLGALRSSEWRVRRNGAAILGKMKAEWAVEPLAKALNDTNGAVRLTAHAALRHIATPAAREALAAAMPSDEEETANEKEKTVPPPNKDPMPRQKTPELERIREGTKPKRPTNPDGTPIKLKPDDTHKIAWPRRTRRKNRPENQHIAPTKPLNPETLEEAQNRIRRMQARRGSNGSHDE